MKCPNCNCDELMLDEENWIDFNEIEAWFICGNCNKKCHAQRNISWDDPEDVLPDVIKEDKS